jgi:hypothetical protein
MPGNTSNTSDNRRPLTDKEVKRIATLPVLALPYTFPNGSKLEGLSVQCAVCGKSLEGADLKGEFISYNEFSVALDGYAACSDCQVFSPFSMKVRNDGTLLIKTVAGWKESRYARPAKASFISRIWQLLSGTGGA